MPTIKELIDLQDEFKVCLKNRNIEHLIPEFEKGILLQDEYKNNRLKYDEIRREVKQLSENYQKSSSTDIKQKSKELGKKEAKLQEEAREIAEKLEKIEIMMPNWYSDDTPIGKGDEYEKTISYSKDSKKPLVWNKYEKDFKSLYPECDYSLTDKEPFHHYKLVGSYIDQEKGGNVAESRFYFELDELVILDMALNLYAIEFFRNKGFADRLMIPPFMMRQSIEKKTTYFEAFEDTIFSLNDDKLLLLPSSEHSIINFYNNELFNFDDIPIRITAWSPCFRREAGAHGKDTRGIFRVKQFVKVELHSIVEQGKDVEEVELYTKAIEEFMASLNLPTRTVIVPTGEMDKRAVKQIDVQAWLPGQGRFRETHSIASIGTWVSEKIGIRYRTENKRKLKVMNVYATGVAIQRMLCVIAENHYDHNSNSIIIPEALKKYSMGLERINLK